MNAPRQPSAQKRAVKLIELYDDRSAGSLPARIFRRIRDLILEGSLAAGTTLPPSRVLAKALAVSRNSVVTAYGQLSADGWITSHHGSGVRVARKPPGGAKLTPAKGEIFDDDTARKPFLMSEPDLKLFPVNKWRALQAQSWKSMPVSALYQRGYGAGWPDLRRAIASHVATSRGVRCSPEQVFVTMSQRIAFNGIVRALNLAGTKAWVEDPGYFAGPGDYSSRNLFEANNIGAVPVRVDAKGICVADGIRDAPDARFAIVTSGSEFPLGMPLAPARQDALLAWADKSQSWIVEDDGDFHVSGPLSPPLAASADPSRVIYINSFNTMLFPALRVAYLVVPKDLISRFSEVEAHLDNAPNVPNQIVLAKFMDRGLLDEHLIRSRQEYALRRATLLGGIKTHLSKHLIVQEKNSRLHMIATLRQLSETEFARFERPGGIEIVPLTALSANTDHRPTVMLGFAALPPQQIIQSVQAIASALR